MSKKFAVFVEGATEQEFTIRLLTELAGHYSIEFEIHTQYRGSLNFTELRTSQTPDIHILVANCCNDEQVKSQIIDQYESLKLAGYSLIVGLRDVYPFNHDDIEELESGMSFGLPVGDTPIHIHLAIMEIEAWFIEEITHFSRIDNGITLDALVDNGFDHNNTCASELAHPAETLGNIYKYVGKGYSKNKRQVQRTIDALSYEELYINTRQKSSSLNNYIISLEKGLGI